MKFCNFFLYLFCVVTLTWFLFTHVRYTCAAYPSGQLGASSGFHQSTDYIILPFPREGALRAHLYPTPLRDSR